MCLWLMQFKRLQKHIANDAVLQNQIHFGDSAKLRYVFNEIVQKQTPTYLSICRAAKRLAIAPAFPGDCHNWRTIQSARFPATLCVGA